MAEAPKPGTTGETGARPGHRPPGFVVLVADPETGEIDGFGPYAETGAHVEAVRRRHELDAERLEDVLVVVVALTPPP